jgi:hypothetical protein
MFRLVFVSLWTTYSVGTFGTIEDAAHEAARRYSARNLTFKRDTDDILKAMIDADGEIVILNLYENEPAHAPLHR